MLMLMLMLMFFLMLLLMLFLIINLILMLMLMLFLIINLILMLAPASHRFLPQVQATDSSHECKKNAALNSLRFGASWSTRAYKP